MWTWSELRQTTQIKSKMRVEVRGARKGNRSSTVNKNLKKVRRRLLLRVMSFFGFQPEVGEKGDGDEDEDGEDDGNGDGHAFLAPSQLSHAVGIVRHPKSIDPQLASVVFLAVSIIQSITLPCF